MMFFIYFALDGHKGHPYIFKLFPAGVHFSMLMDYELKREEQCKMVIGAIFRI